MTQEDYPQSARNHSSYANQIESLESQLREAQRDLEDVTSQKNKIIDNLSQNIKQNAPLLIEKEQEIIKLTEKLDESEQRVQRMLQHQEKLEKDLDLVQQEFTTSRDKTEKIASEALEKALTVDELKKQILKLNQERNHFESREKDLRSLEAQVEATQVANRQLSESL